MEMHFVIRGHGKGEEGGGVVLCDVQRVRDVTATSQRSVNSQSLPFCLGLTLPLVARRNTDPVYRVLKGGLIREREREGNDPSSLIGQKARTPLPAKFSFAAPQTSLQEPTGSEKLEVKIVLEFGSSFVWRNLS